MIEVGAPVVVGVDLARPGRDKSAVTFVGVDGFAWTATFEETEKALAFYRKHLERSKIGQRAYRKRKRGGKK
ncbi:MAG TPA: hypothetical protein VMQ76_01250 [Terracidiphilus sp.]|nr:hypothetical protein [Terracidiphilus sp.]